MWSEYLARSSPPGLRNCADEFPLKPVIKAEDLFASVEWSSVCASGQRIFHSYGLAWLPFLTPRQHHPFSLSWRCWCLLVFCKWMHELEVGTLLDKTWLAVQWFPLSAKSSFPVGCTGAGCVEA